MCTHDRRRLLADADTHAAFREYCLMGIPLRVLVGRYVLMPDHLHLLVQFSHDSLSLSRWAKSLKNSLSKHWRALGLPSPHWQKGFFDHVLRTNESYALKWSYVTENPVRAGLTKRAADWPYAGCISELRF